MCGPRQLFLFQSGPETPKAWTPLQALQFYFGHHYDISFWYRPSGRKNTICKPTIAALLIRDPWEKQALMVSKYGPGTPEVPETYLGRSPRSEPFSELYQNVNCIFSFLFLYLCTVEFFRGYGMCGNITAYGSRCENPAVFYFNKH